MAENKQYVVQAEEAGAVMISEDVIAAIVAQSISEVEGVAALNVKPGADIANLIGKKNWGKGMKVIIAEDDQNSDERGGFLMQELLERAAAMAPQLIADRRWLHAHAETGFDLPETYRYVWEALTDMGLAPRRCGRSGIIADVGMGERFVLLRAEMDALPIREVGLLGEVMGATISSLPKKN